MRYYQHLIFYTIQRPFTEVSNLLENGVELRIFIWCKPADYFRVREPAIENIKYAFDEHGIIMAHPQRVVHLERSGE